MNRSDAVRFVDGVGPTPFSRLPFRPLHMILPAAWPAKLRVNALIAVAAVPCETGTAFARNCDDVNLGDYRIAGAAAGNDCGSLRRYASAATSAHFPDAHILHIPALGPLLFTVTPAQARRPPWRTSDGSGDRPYSGPKPVCSRDPHPAQTGPQRNAE